VQEMIGSCRNRTLIVDYPRTENDRKQMRQFLVGIPLQCGSKRVRFPVSARWRPPDILFRGKRLPVLRPIKAARILEWVVENGTSAPYRYSHDVLQRERREIPPVDHHHHWYALLPNGSRCVGAITGTCMYLISGRFVYLLHDFGRVEEECIFDTVRRAHELVLKDVLFATASELIRTQHAHKRFEVIAQLLLNNAELAAFARPLTYRRNARSLQRQDDEGEYAGLLRVPARLPYRTGDNRTEFIYSPLDRPLAPRQAQRSATPTDRT